MMWVPGVSSGPAASAPFYSSKPSFLHFSTHKFGTFYQVTVHFTEVSNCQKNVLFAHQMTKVKPLVCFLKKKPNKNL